MRISRLMLSLLLAPVASAGVIVVDSNNGPGTDFTSLSAAIAAANDGDLLLLRGSFDGSFVVSGKALSIVGDSGPLVSLRNSALGDPNAPALQVGSDVNGIVFVRGLKLSTPAGGGIPFVASGVGAPGRHLFAEELNVPASAGVGMRLSNGSPMTLAHCTATGGSGHTDGAGLPVAGAPAVLAQAGPLDVCGGFLSGGNGYDAGLYVGTPFPGQNGQPGIEVHSADASLKLLGSAICIGGQGGAGAAPGGNCLAPGDGGFGVLATLGSAKILGLFGLGGFGGTATPGCGSNGLFGDLLGSSPPGQLPTWQNGGPTQVTATRVVREGDTISVNVSDLAGTHVVLMVGLGLQSVTLPKFSGVMVVDPLFSVDLGNLGTGSVTVSEHVPELGPGVESMTLYIQAVSKTFQNYKVFGEVSSTVLLDSQF